MLKKSTSLFVAFCALAFFTISSFAKMRDENKDSSHTLAKTSLLKNIAQDVRTITIKNDYSIDIPNHLYVSTELNADASLQYNDTAVEEYIIVIDESKVDFIRDFSGEKGYNTKYTVEKNYRMVQMKSMSEKMKTKHKPVVTAQKINGLDAEIVDFDATVPGIDAAITYKVGFVEGPKNLYMIMTWTLMDLKQTHLNEMNEMIQSFRVVN